MFKWLTRNDGARVARAKRRIASSRASVFTEFAIVMPIVVMVCSALIEVVGFWDAQVMANHAAWTVGRIVMVRGSDGLEFSSAASKKSKTGIEGSNMPDALKKALASLDTVIHGANLFNNRGNIATMFLMSTCGIGYYGKSPGKTLDDGLKALCEAGMKALTEGIPDSVKDMVSDFTLPEILSGGGIMGELAKKLINKVVDDIVQALLKPLAEKLQGLIQDAFDSIFGKGGSKIDDFFNGDSEAAWHARQMFGAAQRIARAKSTIGKEVLTVKDMDELNGGYMFAKQSNLKRLVYPQCVDSDAKSDGYFVKNPSGWPPNDNGLAMVHVEINWPYESGWLFPVVSGRSTPAASMSSPPVARGHSMVFPQPNIANDNLYSEGAKAFEPGAYTNNPNAKAMEDLANEMKDYLRCIKFCMQYRIGIESISLHDGDWSWETFTDWKDCPELMKVFGIKSIPAKDDTDYAKTWKELTGTSSQRPTWDSIKDRFDPGYYHSHEYFFWDNKKNAQGKEVAHYRYGASICSANGNSYLGDWYDSTPIVRSVFGDSKGLTYADSSLNRFEYSKFSFKITFNSYLNGLSDDDKKWLRQFQADSIYRSIGDFAGRNKVNVYNIVKWIEGHSLAEWVAQDKDVHEAAKKADASFAEIQKLICNEIKDIDNILDDKAQYTGDPDDPVLDPDDEEVVKDPEKAEAEARKKWNTMKANLHKKLDEVEDAAVALRTEFGKYKEAGNKFRGERKKCVGEYFVTGCLNTLVKTKNRAIFDSGNDSSFKIPAGLFPYDIGKGTREMREKIREYQDAVNKSYKLEVEYGAMLGLQSAGKAKRDGKSPDEIIDGGGSIDEDTPGSMSSGSDTGDIIDKDHQSYSGGEWKWN